MDPIDCAAKGDTEFFKLASYDVLLNSRDEEEGNSVLSVAVQMNHLDCSKEIFKKCPSLLYKQSILHKYTALHHAGWRGEVAMVKFLIDAAAETVGTIPGYKELFRLVDTWEQTGLHKAVIQQNLETVKLLIEEDHDNELLRMTDETKNTALHLAVENRNLEIVKVLIEADPQFEYCANNSGDTPLGLTLTAMGDEEPPLPGNSGKIIKLLLEKQPSQAKVRFGDNGWTLLHHATHKGDISVIEDIISFCPDCSELVNNENQTFVHLAAKFGRVKVMKHILGTKEISTSILNMQDIYGNTPLHIAALGEKEIMTSCLLYDLRVNKFTMNKKGQEVLDAINFEYDKAKAGVYGIGNRMSQKELKDQSDFDLVVGALIAAVSFTAGITVPGGYINEGPLQGMAVFSKKTSFIAFVISNNFALMCSLYAVFSHFCTRWLRKKEDISCQLNVATLCTLGSIFAMMVAFITGSYTVLSNSNGLAITTCVHCCCFFIFAFFAIWRIVMQYRISNI